MKERDSRLANEAETDDDEETVKPEKRKPEGHQMMTRSKSRKLN